MKRISPLLFLVVMAWSWTKVHQESQPNFATHVNLQAELRDLVFKAVQEKFPQAREIQILQLWTERQNAHRILAELSYRFEAPDQQGSWNQQEVKGSVLLTKAVNSPEDVWTLGKFKSQHNAIDFQEGLVIRPTQPQVTE